MKQNVRIVHKRNNLRSVPHEIGNSKKGVGGLVRMEVGRVCQVHNETLTVLGAI